MTIQQLTMKQVYLFIYTPPSNLNVQLYRSTTPDRYFNISFNSIIGSVFKSSRNHQNIAHKVRFLDESYLTALWHGVAEFLFGILEKKKETPSSVYSRYKGLSDTKSSTDFGSRRRQRTCSPLLIAQPTLSLSISPLLAAAWYDNTLKTQGKYLGKYITTRSI